MFDLVHQNKRFVQGILLAIIITFAVWGVGNYSQSGSGDALASVGDLKVTQLEFERAVSQQQERLKRMTGGKLDPALFDKPEIKQAVLNELVNKKLLANMAREVGLEPTDGEVAQVISTAPVFQKDGKFDKKRYKAWLDNQGLTPSRLEATLREDISVSQMAETFSQNGYAPSTVIDNLIRLNEQQRTVSVVQISPESLMGRVKVGADSVRKYYEDNQREFAIPERVRAEYVLFSADSLLSQETASAEEIKEYYEQHRDEFVTSPEQRHAAHILIMAQGSEDEKKAARDKAESILKEVKQSPEKFAELARQYSEDPGSKNKGGDLGFFTRDRMVKPFADATFSLNPGEISGVVQSDFGFHIIKLLEIKAAQVKPLNMVKADVALEVKRQKARRKFAKLAEEFDQTAFEQSDSLKPAAKVANASIQQSQWLEKGMPPAGVWTDKVLQALFSDNILKKKRNSGAIEVAPNTLIAVRLLDYKEAGVRPFAEVSDGIKKKLMRQQATELAAKNGEDALAQLQQGGSPRLKWESEKRTVSRMAQPPKEVGPELLRRIMRSDVSKLPVYVGAETAQGGYVLARVEAVKDVEDIADAKRSAYAQQVFKAYGDELLQSSVAEAREHTTINARNFAGGKAKQ